MFAAVPLSPLHPQNTLLYYASDSKASFLIATKAYADLMHRVSKNTNAGLHIIEPSTKLELAAKPSDFDLPLSLNFYSKSNALILYTSGTTGNPKGVVLSHKNLVFQINTLLQAWKWGQNDVILHTLPLHHVHGIVNALLCPLYIGAKVVMLPKFDTNAVWSHLLGVNAKPNDRKVNIFMAVPTIYAKLIEEYEKVFGDDAKMVEHIRTTLKNKIRLMVSGSAPLPVPVYEKWFDISGHKLLERYGMTEIGMCLSNLYDSDRKPGQVGLPLPGVSVRLEDQNKVILECTNNNGELQFKCDEEAISDKAYTGELLVKSDGVFKEYFNRPEATQKEFTKDGWFRTGDVSSYHSEEGVFKLLGRKSADIIKSGGYKISAIHIETELLEHPDIKECAIVGIEDEKWGQKVAAVVLLKENKTMTLDQLKEWASDKMPKYTIPSVLKIVDAIPKNAMGKVNKKTLVVELFQENKKTN